MVMSDKVAVVRILRSLEIFLLERPMFFLESPRVLLGVRAWCQLGKQKANPGHRVLFRLWLVVTEVPDSAP